MRMKENKHAKYRRERDALGMVKVPSDAYYGSDTQRALETYSSISGMTLQDGFLMVYVRLKRCAARANMRTGRLERRKGAAIMKACGDVLGGKTGNRFLLDVFQAGAGTNTNMNVNEVIANRAIEILGGRKGEYSIIHPNDHVNMSQSTNDTMPTVIRVSSYLESEKLVASLVLLGKELSGKAAEFHGIVKIGRTHLQDAVPIRLGDEFGAYAAEVGHARKAVEVAMAGLLRVPIGGTAVGTGMNADREYKKYMLEEMRKEFGIGIKGSENVFADMQSRLAELDLSNALVESAVALGKIANDFRLLSSGPDAGFAELTLPAVHPGSSIMPGKINPSVAEMLNMVCFQVIGNGAAVREAAAAGQLELNVFMPVMAFDLLFSIRILANGSRVFAEKCVRGAKANKARITQYTQANASIATALTPYIGYSKAAEIAKLASKNGKSVKEVCVERGILDEKILDRILDPKESV